MIEFRANKNPIRRLSINLGVPVSDDQYDVAGEQLAVWNSPNAGDTIYVKLDDNSNDSIPLRRGDRIREKFERLYITVPAGLAGTMLLTFGTGPRESFDLQPATPGSSQTRRRSARTPE